MIITGVGSRNLPTRVEKIIVEYGSLYAKEHDLRTGDAVGSDHAFTMAWKNSRSKRIFVSEINRVRDEYHVLGNEFQFEKAKLLVESLRPHVKRLDEYARRLHYRNAFQVLGLNLDTPSDVLVCYAEPKNSIHVKGGTNTAVQIAKMYNIPVYNLYYEEDIKKFIKMRIFGLCF